jgi:hypothetical protein
MNKKIIFGVLVLLILCFAIYTTFNPKSDLKVLETPKVIEHKDEPIHVTLGKSVEGRDIDLYTFGNGSTTLLFVGGIHGGYEWNSVLLAYKFIDLLSSSTNLIPSELKVLVIPSLNPDGVFKIVKKEGRFAISDIPKGENAEGRFNANGVDLNRNFDCNWQKESTWRNKKVSAGEKSFSEPESQILKNLIEQTSPSGVVFWHSASGNVYASECNDGIVPATLHLMNSYANASGYGAVESFDAYKVTGDAEGWLASIGIPAITVELKTHTDIEWEKNLAGFKSILFYFAGK